MSTLQIEVPANSGLLSSNGEVFQHDPKIPAEIRISAVTTGKLWDDVPDKLVRIEHSVTDTRGRRFVFTSFVHPRFFWDQMYLAHTVATSREQTRLGALLKDSEQTLLIENLYSYWDGRECRALWCFGFGATAEKPTGVEKVFPIHEKHISPTMNLIAVKRGKEGGWWLIVEFCRLKIFESVDGTEFGGNDSDKFCYQMRPEEVFWRNFLQPMTDPPGSAGNPNNVNYDSISPLMPIIFKPWEG